MPKIPIYGRQAQLPGTTGPFIKQPVTAKAQAQQGLGSAVLAAGQKLGEERSSMEANDAMSLLGDRYRTWNMEERKKTGLEAVGATERTGKWFDENIRDIEGTLSRDALRKFKPSALQARGGGMDSMAGHELTQHHERKRTVLQRHTAQAQQFFIDKNLGQASLDFMIQQGNKIIDEQFTGLSEKDRSAMKAAQEDTITMMWIQEKAKTEPFKMLELIDQKKYKNMFSKKDYDALKAEMKRDIDNTLGHEKAQELLVETQQDYDQAILEAGKISNDQLRKTTIRVLKNERSQYRNEKAFQDKEWQKEQEHNVINLINDYNWDAAQSVIGQRRFDAGSAKAWNKYISDMRKINPIKGQNVFYHNDWEQISKTWNQVMEDPTSMTTEEAQRLWGKGFDQSQTASLVKFLTTAQKAGNKGKTTLMKTGLNAIKDHFDRGGFDPEGSHERMVEDPVSGDMQLSQNDRMTSWARRANMEQLYRTLWQEDEAAKGDPITREKRIVQQLLTEGEKQKWPWYQGIFSSGSPKSRMKWAEERGKYAIMQGGKKFTIDKTAVKQHGPKKDGSGLYVYIMWDGRRIIDDTNAK
jgi:hypothetical protein